MSDRSAKPELRPHCYICGTCAAPLTEDHIPPESFFLKGDRKNLFKAPLCEQCHRPLSLDDEVMRFFLSLVEGVSESGRKIFNEEAYPKMLAKPKLWAQVKKYMKPQLIQTPVGVEERMVAGLLQSRAIPFIRRITKGFLYLLYPEYDYFEDQFSVYQRRLIDVVNLLPLLRHESRGAKVIDLWHGFAADTRTSAIWIYRFYNATCFVCMHSKSSNWTQQFPPNYKEWPKLPRYL